MLVGKVSKPGRAEKEQKAIDDALVAKMAKALCLAREAHKAAFEGRNESDRHVVTITANAIFAQMQTAPGETRVTVL